MKKVYVGEEDAPGTGGPSRDVPVQARAPQARRREPLAQHSLLVLWIGIVAAPWILQLRSFSELAARHKITQNLIPPEGATGVTTEADVVTHCPLLGMLIAGVWYSMYPSHYFETGDSVICHMVTPQYNSHGMFTIQKRKIERIPSAPTSCANDSYAGNYYFYHGSISYYSLYSEGEGSYCSHDNTMYTVTTAVGSTDMNCNTLAHCTTTPGYHSSYIFCAVGGLWLAYRAIVLTRSFRSCARYGRRLDALKERISISNSVVYVQQAARLAPHSANNWHRLALVYLLAEGLMTDLFLVIAHDGFGAKLQYISLGYNISGLLSMLFEIVENTNLLKPPARLFVKRVLFNTELSVWGELLFSIAMSHYLTSLNRSDLGPTRKVAQAMSHYAWGLINHGIIVLGQSAFILTVRTLGTSVFVLFRFGSLRMLVTPCCVDSIMGSRYKLATISGYEFHGSRLCYAKETLKAHGLLKIVADGGNEYLVYHKVHWLPIATEDLTVVGLLVDKHVELCAEKRYSGPVSVCDRMLGGLDEERGLRNPDKEQDLESAPLVNGSTE